MNNETELDNSLELSVQERMNLSVKGYTNAIVAIAVMVTVIFLSALIGWVSFQDHVSPSPDFNSVDNVNTIFYFLMIISVGGVVWLIRTGRKIFGENRRINREYTQQAYLIALSLSSRTGDDVSLDFYNIARDIFPELKKLDVESMKESGKENDVEGLEVNVGDWAWKKTDKYTFDIVQKTQYGNFIIKDFKKKASYDDLEQCLKVANKQDDLKNGLRLVCLAEDYDGDILKKYKELVEGSNIPADLILVNEKGFSVLQISEKVEKYSTT